jgi:hypothetical protein
MESRSVEVIPVIKLALLMFAALGFAGAGAALAVGRMHDLESGDHDIGMRALALVLAVFSAICTASAAGVAGVAAFGGVIMWCSYVLWAQRIGVFRIEYFKPRASEPAGR